MNASQNKSKKVDETFSKKTRVTPRALVRKQVENKDFHVSDEDMANLDTSIEAIRPEIKELTKQMGNDK